jgi:hypothetical protein
VASSCRTSRVLCLNRYRRRLIAAYAGARAVSARRPPLAAENGCFSRLPVSNATLPPGGCLHFGRQRPHLEGSLGLVSQEG